MLCHYQNIGPWRRPPALRSGPPPRVWLDGAEVEDVYARFAAVQLTPEPVIDISGASGVTLMLAMAHGRDWPGHVPGPWACPAAIPIALKGGRIGLDLPEGLDREAAIAWNGRFEAENGLVIGTDGRARYTGRLHDALKAESPDSRPDLHVADLEQVWQAMGALRDRMLARPA